MGPPDTRTTDESGRPREAPSDRFAFVEDGVAERLLALLAADLRANNSGLLFIAPEYPEAGQEMTIGLELELPDFVWITGDYRRPLSQAILRDCNDADEILRTAQSLENTAKVLMAAIARGCVT